jgi:hypothetical protein
MASTHSDRTDLKSAVVTLYQNGSPSADSGPVSRHQVVGRSRPEYAASPRTEILVHRVGPKPLQLIRLERVGVP